MKAKDPIQFSTMIEYYTSQRVLRRPKDQLTNQMKDLLVISQFLLNRIPASMKMIKDSVRVQHKSIKDLGEHVRKDIQNIFNDPKSSKAFYIETAYDQMSNFCRNKQVNLGYVDKTIAEKQIKLKFLESKNLPNDFIWHKPPKPTRQIQKDGDCMNRDYNQYSYFNTKLNMIQIPTRKYRLLISLKVVNSCYKWLLFQIQLRSTSEPQIWLHQIFQQKIIPQVSKNCESPEENMLSWISSYAYFLQILQLNEQICALAQVDFYCQNLSYTYKKYRLQFQFPRIESLQNPIVKVTYQQFELRLIFQKKKIKAEFSIQNLFTLSLNEHFTYNSGRSLVNQILALIQNGKRIKKFYNLISKNHQGANQNQMKQQTNNIVMSELSEYIICKINGQYWFSKHKQQVQQIQKLKYYDIKNQICIAKFINNKLVHCQINYEGLLTSSKISRPFLRKLCKYAKNISVILYFIYVIQVLCQQNGNNQSEIDHYQINDKVKGKQKVVLYNRKKSCIEDQMIKAITKNNSTDEQHFNSIKSFSQFNMDFTQLTFYRFFKDPEQTYQLYEQQQWKPYFNLKHKQPTPLSIQKVMQVIRYVQDNMIYRYVVERKLKSDSKYMYKTLI